MIMDPDNEQPPEAPFPQSYPIEEALTAAMAPEPGHHEAPQDWNNRNIPQHSDDLLDRRNALLRQIQNIDDKLGQMGHQDTATVEGNGNGASATATGHQAAAATEQERASVMGPLLEPLWLPRPPARAEVPPVADTVPETVAQTIAGLPQWMQKFCLALMDLGGNPALAANCTNVSLRSVNSHMAQYPQFAQAVKEAVEHSTHLAEGFVYQRATIGVLEPKFQGGVRVGFVRKQSDQAAKLIFDLRGKLSRDPEQGNKHQSQLPQVSPEAVPALVAACAAKLFAMNKGRPIKTINATTGKVEQQGPSGDRAAG